MRKKIGLAFALILVLILTASSFALGSFNETTQEAKSISKHHHKHFGKHQLEDISKILGIDSKILSEELKTGKTLKEIAVAHGIDETTLLKRLEIQINERIAQSVKEGKLSQEKAEKIKNKLPEKLTKMVNKKWDNQSDYHHRGFKKELFKGVHEQIQSSLKMNSEELKTELKSGKSLTQIAKSKNIDAKELSTKILQTVEQNLDQLVKDKKISEGKAENIRQKLPKRIEKMMQQEHNYNK